MNWLEVQYHDNDFSWPVERGLERVWNFINENNRHLGADISKIFARLHREKKLAPLFQRAFVLEELMGDVEFATRGLESPRIYKDGAEIKRKVSDKISEYIMLDEIKFHKTDKFTNTCQNGEHAALNLLTGKARSF